MLIAMSSLDAAAKAYDIPESKGSMPHLYLQNCASLTQILERINTPVPWATLEPYIDWFHAVSHDDLHKRVKGRSFEAWREEQPTRKEFHKHVNNEDVCDFREMLVEYLDKDVNCLFLLIETIV